MRCDCHLHVVGPVADYPQLPQRTYLCGEASLAAVRALGAERGVTRFVIVQPSFYGTDNRALLEALDALGGQGRGVAVCDPASVEEGTLKDWHARGVRGLRLNLYSPLGAKGDMAAVFMANATLAARMGWHVEVVASLATLIEAADRLAASPAPVVIDHYGIYGSDRPTDEHGRALLSLLAQPHVWIKLSAPYRTAVDPHETRPDPEWLRAMLDTAADRCVWGSDWPWTAGHDTHQGSGIVAPFRPLSYAALVDRFREAVADDALCERIMADNAARLYGF